MISCRGSQGFYRRPYIRKHWERSQTCLPTPQYTCFSANCEYTVYRGLPRLSLREMMTPLMAETASIRLTLGLNVRLAQSLRTNTHRSQGRQGWVEVPTAITIWCPGAGYIVFSPHNGSNPSTHLPSQARPEDSVSCVNPLSTECPQQAFVFFITIIITNLISYASPTLFLNIGSNINLFVDSLSMC